MRRDERYRAGVNDNERPIRTATVMSYLVYLVVGVQDILRKMFDI